MTDDDDLLTTHTTVVTIDTAHPSGEGRARTETSSVYDLAYIPGGSIIGDYVIGRRIGSGDSGTVYVARHRENGERAAFKVLYPNLGSSPRLVQWFTRELETLRLLQHPNIIAIYDIGQLGDGRPYYVTELLTGMNLTELLKIHAHLAPLEALEILDPVCEALHAGHGTNIVHGNLKSNNVMVVEDDDKRAVKLLDFAITGLVAATTGADTLRGSASFPGSSETAAPEQLLGQPIGAYTDIYALGVLLYQVLTGEYPFAGDDAEIVAGHLMSFPPRPSQLAPLSQAVDAVVLRCLDKDPHRRYDSAESVRSALHRALANEKKIAREKPKNLAIFICVAARTAERDETVHNDVLRGVMMFLDDTEEVLREAGFAIAANVTEGILGIKPLPADPTEEREVRGNALELACSLYAELEEQTLTDQSIDVHIVLRMDTQFSYSTSGEFEVSNEAIKQIRSWGVARTGIYAASETVVDLPSAQTNAPTLRGHVELDPSDWL